VVVAAGTGAVRLSVEGVALEDGNAGERIAVQAGDADRAVFARVVSAGRVTIDE
jgi:flagella basal body P-ring formation protein FlgA